MLFGDAQNDHYVRLAEALGAFAGAAALLYGLFRKRKPGAEDEVEERTESPLTFGRHFPWIGCFIGLGLLVFAGFAYVFIKHVIRQ